MLKKLRELVWIALLPVTLVCILPSCGGGGGGGDAADQGIRPSSLNGVTLDFGGAIITFTSPAPNISGTSVETGGMFYEPVNDDTVRFSPADPTNLNGADFSWPTDIAGSSYYEYRAIDGSSGLLTIYPESLEGGLLDNSVPGSFDTIVLSFSASGDIISGISIVYSLTNGGQRWQSDQFTVTGTIGGLTDTPRPIPTGWNGLNEGPGFIADPSFLGQLLTLTDDGGDVEIVLAPFVSPGGPAGDGDSSIEEGSVSVAFTIGLTGGPGTTSLFEADYTLTQPYGTENVILALVYTGSFPGDPTPGNDTITLTFTGGGVLENDVEVLYGTYTRDGGFGTFVLGNP